MPDSIFAFPVLKRVIPLALLIVTLTGEDSLARAQSASLERLQVSEMVWMLSGRGGNVAVVVTGDGVIVIDTQYSDSAPAIIEQIREITSLPIRYVINTHVHGDHVGGNAVLQQDADIIAHRNTFERMSASGADTDALPRIVFESGMVLRTGGVEIQLLHQERAHTDTDVAVWLPVENVLISGDLFFNRMTPYVDQERGAFIPGWITFINTLTRLGDTGTKVVPGHGELSDMDGLRGMAHYFEAIQRIVQDAHAAGRSKEEILTLTLEDLGAPFTEWEGGRLGMALAAAYDELTGR
ncbi:MBL fold metallo-hydrolase [Gemmatimonadota bacterium]